MDESYFEKIKTIFWPTTVPQCKKMAMVQYRCNAKMICALILPGRMKGGTRSLAGTNVNA